MNHRFHSRLGFTLIELLVTIAIIAVLVGLVIVAMSGVRKAATRAKSLSALRQMATGYASYSTDHNNRLMPGYIHPDDFMDDGAFRDLKVTLPNGETIIHPEDNDGETDAFRLDAGSYVWRLAPYVGNDWKIMYEDYSSKSLLTRLEEEFDGAAPGIDGDEIYGQGTAGYGGTPDNVGIAHAPAYGLNSIMLGGDSVHGPDAIVQNHPWADGSSTNVAAKSVSAIKNPSKIITFAASAQMNLGLTPPQVSSDEITYGYAAIMAPFLSNADDALDANWINPQWNSTSINNSTYLVTANGVTGGIGVPVSRWGSTNARTLDVNGQYALEGLESVPAAQADGSVSTYDAARMAVDMGLWHWNYQSVISAGQ